MLIFLFVGAACSALGGDSSGLSDGAKDALKESLADEDIDEYTIIYKQLAPEPNPYDNEGNAGEAWCVLVELPDGWRRARLLAKEGNTWHAYWATLNTFDVHGCTGYEEHYE